MIALLIKPAAMKKRSHRNFISSLKQNGAIQLQGHNSHELNSELKQLLANHADLTVVACGGDGTVNLAVNAIADLEVKFAVAPMGTGNDFARHIKIRNLQHAKQILNSESIQEVDLGSIQLVNGEVKRFIGVASCGFDAQVNERANQLSGPSGTFKYLWSVLTELKELTPIKLTVITDRTEVTEVFTLIAIGNTSSYGGGMRITPTADITDGIFTITSVAQVKRRTLLRVLPTVFTGRHVRHPAVTVSESCMLEISQNKFVIYADGERIGQGPAKFAILPARLRLLVPSNI